MRASFRIVASHRRRRRDRYWEEKVGEVEREFVVLSKRVKRVRIRSARRPSVADYAGDVVPTV